MTVVGRFRELYPGIEADIALTAPARGSSPAITVVQIADESRRQLVQVHLALAAPRAAPQRVQRHRHRDARQPGR